MLASAPAALLSSTGSPTTPYVAIAIDVLIGVSLVRGNLKYRSLGGAPLRAGRAVLRRDVSGQQQGDRSGLHGGLHR